MNIGRVAQKEMVIGSGETERVQKYLELTIRPPFGNSLTATISKRKPKEGDSANAPEYDIWFSSNRKNEKFARTKIGALWVKISERQNKYMSGYIESPAIPNGGKMYLSIVKYTPIEGMPVEPILYNVLWSAPQVNTQSHSQDNYDGGGYAGEPTCSEPPSQGNTVAGANGVKIPVVVEQSIPEIDINEDEIPF